MQPLAPAAAGLGRAPLCLRRAVPPARAAPWPAAHAVHAVPAVPAVLPRRSALGEVYGVPKVHFKGQQGDFYVMVRALRPLVTF